MWNPRRAALSPRLLRVTLALFGLSVMSGCNPKPNPQGEQCTEMIGMPKPKIAIAVDGNTGDWEGIAPQLTRKDGKPHTGAYRLTEVHVAADDAKIYLWVDIASDGVASSDGGATSPDGGRASPQCNNGTCEPGEDFRSCPDDCWLELHVHMKTSGFSQGEIYIIDFGEPLQCRGNWWGDHGGEQKDIDCAVGWKVTSEGLSFEFSLDRSDFGAIFSLYPTLSHPQNDNSPPIIDDEIGCVWTDTAL